MSEKPYINDHIIEMLERIKNTKHGNWKIYLFKLNLPYKLLIKDGIVKPINNHYKPLGITDIGKAIDYDTVTLYDAPVINSLYLTSVTCALCLYTDNTAPWINKSNLKEYVSKLNIIYGGLDCFLSTL